MPELIQGDALTELGNLPDSTFAVCVTSPPYNIGHNHEKAGKGYGTPGRGSPGRRWQGQYPGGFTDRLSPDDYVEYHRAVVTEILRVLTPDGLLWYVHQERPHPRGRTEPDLVRQVLDGYPVRHKVIWHKPGGIFNCAWKAPQFTGGLCYPVNDYEEIYLLSPTGEGAVSTTLSKVWRSVWTIKREVVKLKGFPKFPASFPVALAERCIALTLTEGPVLDPFLGTGSTALAAVELGRDWTGIELIPETLAIAQTRLNSQQGKLAKLMP